MDKVKVNDLWDAFIEIHNEFKCTLIPESYYFCDNKRDADNLAELVKNKVKTATSSLYVFYELDNEDLPKVDELSIITDFEGNAVAIIQNKRVDILRFSEVTEKLASKEGEGDRSLSYWRRVHKEFFIKYLQKYDLEFDENIKIVYEEFDILFTIDDYKRKKSYKLDYKKLLLSIIVCSILLLFSCHHTQNNRIFTTSFEDIKEFDTFYITPQNHLNTSFHELTEVNVHSGRYAHRGWITGSNSGSTAIVNNNHRAYPTVQLKNLSEGSFKTPCYISLWVWLDMELHKNEAGEDDWFSFATFTDDESDDWKRTILVNLNADGIVHLQHTTAQGENATIFQTSDIVFPQKKWVELKIYLDFGEDAYAKVWQDGKLVSYAAIGNISNKLSQAHFGLYCSPRVSAGEVFNDDLEIKEVESE